jgi:hypothetical protein
MVLFWLSLYRSVSKEGIKNSKGEKMDVANLIFGIIGCVIVLLGEAALVLWFMGEVETT